MLFVSCLRNLSLPPGNDDILSFSKSCVVHLSHLYLLLIWRWFLEHGVRQNRFCFSPEWVLSTTYWKDGPCPWQFHLHKPRVHVRQDPFFGSLFCSLCLFVYACASTIQSLRIHYRLQIHNKFDIWWNVFSLVLILQEVLAILVICIFIYILDSVCQVLPKNPAGILIRTAQTTLRRPYILIVLGLFIHKIIHPFLHVGLLWFF